jgi:hypothetical protein
MSDYIEVLVLAEGRTEKIFVREVLAPAMLAKNIYMDATLVDKIGGDIRFARAKKEGYHLTTHNDVDQKEFKIVTESGVVYIIGDVRAKQAKVVTKISKNTAGVLKVSRILQYYKYVSAK